MSRRASAQPAVFLIVKEIVLHELKSGTTYFYSGSRLPAMQKTGANLSTKLRFFWYLAVLRFVFTFNKFESPARVATLPSAVDCTTTIPSSPIAVMSSSLVEFACTVLGVKSLST